jgi:hypothetical protein
MSLRSQIDRLRTSKSPSKPKSIPPQPEKSDATFLTSAVVLETLFAFEVTTAG